MPIDPEDYDTFKGRWRLPGSSRPRSRNQSGKRSAQVTNTEPTWPRDTDASDRLKSWLLQLGDIKDAFLEGVRDQKNI